MALAQNKMRVFNPKIVLLVFLASLFGSFVTKSQDNAFRKGYILVHEGIYMYKDAGETSARTEKLPYNTEVQILEESSKQFNLGILSCNWLKISYKGKTGFCPEMYLFRSKLVDTIELAHMSICDFLKKTNTPRGFYCEEGSDSTMDHIDSMVIKDVSLPNCYYYLRLLLNNKLDMPIPFVINTTEYSFQECNCKLEVNNTLSNKNKQNTLSLIWHFDGGVTSLKFQKLNKAVSVTIEYSAD